MMPGGPVAKLTSPSGDYPRARLAGLRKPQAYPGANSITVADLQLRTVQARDLIGNGEAEAAAAPRRIRHTIKALPNRLALIRRDSGAVILDLEVRTAAGCAAPHCHVSSRGDIAQGIVEKVHEHFANQPGDARDPDKLYLGPEVDALLQRPVEILRHH